MRREIYRPCAPTSCRISSQPLTVREQGYRVVYEPRALLYEDALAEAGDEFRMRVRVTLRAFHALKDKAALLNPFATACSPGSCGPTRCCATWRSCSCGGLGQQLGPGVAGPGFLPWRLA